MAPLLGLVPQLRRELVAAGDPTRAAAMAAYQRDQFEFFGVKTPPRRVIARPLLHAAGRATNTELGDFAQWCWIQPEREWQYLAVDTLRRGVGQLESGDLDWLRGLIETRSWWDTVDALATQVVGTLVRRDRALAAVMDDWIEDDNLWVARTAMLHQLMWKEATDTVRLFAYARRQAGHPDFFMRKAIGWALRQYARTDPEAVRAFVADHDAELSTLTKREALKRLTAHPPED